MSSRKILVGIDEAGRGPLAGPVAVAAVAQLSRLNLANGKLRDSKRLSPARREEWYGWLEREALAGHLLFAVTLVGEKTIDRLGINRSIVIGLQRALKRLALAPDVCRLKLDGGLRAPKKFISQKTIIRGDTVVPLIMLASIAAKVHRDRRLVRLAKHYPKYQFDIHKGYGTPGHYRALRRHGLSPLHRRSFLKHFNLE